MARRESYEVNCGKCHGSQTQWVKCAQCRGSGFIGKGAKHGAEQPCGQCGTLGDVEEICDRCGGHGTETLWRIVKD